MSAVLLQLQNAMKSFGARHLFEKASFAVNEGEHIGVIGPNGAGKSTLFKILADSESLDSGKVVSANHLRLGYLAQEDNFSDTITVEDYLEEVCIKPVWELKSLGRGLGLTEQHFASAIKSLSGGYRMRCKLLALLGQEPNLLLLDEPTNYLDLESLLVLEQFLLSFKGAFLLISHDREFLRRTTDHVLEIEAGDFTKYNGNIDDYFEQKQLLREQIEKQAFSQQAKRDEILKFAARFGAKATKARQAQSRLKQLGKMQSIEVKALPIKAKIPIPSPVRTGKQVLAADGVQLGYGDKVILKNVTLQFQRGDHIGVVGVNGAGKSTLLKGLANLLKPLAGEFEWGYNVNLAYYAQHVAENLSGNDSVYEAMIHAAHPDVLPQDVRDLAGNLLFSSSDIEKKIRVLSGGEKSRVALGCVLLQKAPLLLLDEPTNHLDFHTVEALTQALESYDGSVITVSHDRSFIRRVAKKILEIRDGAVEVYPGTYDEYVWSLQQGAWSDKDSRATSSPSRSTTSANQGPDKINRKQAQKDLRELQKKIKAVDRAMEKANQELQQLNHSMVNASSEDSLALLDKLHQCQQNIESLEQQWLALHEQEERFQVIFFGDGASHKPRSS